ncbi:MAG: MOSC domain-containing protein [Pseudomonadota bacterium]
MWDELKELLLGLVGAGIALGALYLFVARVQQDQKVGDDDNDDNQAAGPAVAGHQVLRADKEVKRAPTRFTPGGAPSVAALYICPEAGAQMVRVPQIEAVAGRGLEGDRYFLNRGHWSESDECEVTLIAQEDLAQATAETGISLEAGRHRRNVVTRHIDLNELLGKRFRIGDAFFGAARPRPPCLYLQKLTEPGLARALVGRGGVGVHCFRSGPIREGDSIELLNLSVGALLRRAWQSRRSG